MSSLMQTDSNCQALICKLTLIINRGPELFMNCLSLKRSTRTPPALLGHPASRRWRHVIRQTHPDPVTQSPRVGKMGQLTCCIRWALCSRPRQSLRSDPFPVTCTLGWWKFLYLLSDRFGGTAGYPWALSGAKVTFGTSSTYPKCDPSSQHSLLELLPGQGQHASSFCRLQTQARSQTQACCLHLHSLLPVFLRTDIQVSQVLSKCPFPVYAFPFFVFTMHFSL